MSLLSRLVTLPKRQPLLFGLGFSCAKTGFADFLVQKYVEKREELDVRRNAAFALFGFAYLGALSVRREPTAAGWVSASRLGRAQTTCEYLTP